MICPIFICPEPREPTELLKNAKNRFQIGLVFPGRKTQIPKFSLHHENEFFFTKCTLTCSENYCWSELFQARRRLNAITHPAIIRETIRQVLRYFFSGARYIVLDTPLLFEAKYDRFMQRVVVVDWSVITLI